MSEKKPCILVIDDEKNAREGLEAALEDKYTVILAEDAVHGLRKLSENKVDIVLTDLRMAGMDGMEFTRQVTKQENAPLVIMLTAYGSVETALQAMKEGAYDYLTKPINLDELEMMIDRGLETLKARQTDSGDAAVEGIVGTSKCMADVVAEARQIAAASRSTVLITGESGTGKEVFAKAIHRLSQRRDKPFVAVHCAALNENLLESELFGHERGAFTGATERQLGRFERADGGSLFLDEIGEISPATQVKLLRVLETRSFERVGSTQQIEVDVRLIAATNRDLLGMVKAGTFREDLYYRLNVVNLKLPPLREHADDIPALLDYYLKQAAEDNGRAVNGFTSEAVTVLTSYSWPGNIRELRNCVERMVVLARGTSLTLSDVPVEIRKSLGEQLLEKRQTEGGSAPLPQGEELDIKSNERKMITEALAKCDGNRTKAAELLGISRRTLHRKLKEFGQ